MLKSVWFSPEQAMNDIAVLVGVKNGVTITISQVLIIGICRLKIIT